MKGKSACIIMILICSMLLFIIVGVLFLNKNEPSNIEENTINIIENKQLGTKNNIKTEQKNNETVLEKIKRYSETTEKFDFQDEIKENGYISEDSALKIVAQGYITQGKDNEKVTIKKYVSNENVKDATIELTERENDKYWKITIFYSTGSYIEKVEFIINYSTGEIITNGIVLQLNND